MLVRPVMLPTGVRSRTQNSLAAKVWRVIAYLAASFAPATKSDKGTREKFETQDHSRGARNCGGLAQTPAILTVRRVLVGHGGAGVYLALAAIRRGAQRPRPDCRPLDSVPQRSTRPRPL